MANKYLNYEGLEAVVGEVKNLVDTRQPKEDNKGLSTNDYTTPEKTKLAGIDNGAEENAISSISVNGKAQSINNKNVDLSIPTINQTSLTIQKNGTTINTWNNNASSNVTVDIEVPTNNNQLTNGAGYQTASEVSSAITDALSDFTSIKFEIVTQLPETGVNGTIYLISNKTSEEASDEENNSYDEYVWVSNKWEMIGTTNVDLSGYLKKTDIIAISNTEIDNLFL